MTMFIDKKKLSDYTSSLLMQTMTILALLLLSGQLSAADSARIESLQIKQSSGKLRVSFNVSKQVKYKAFALKKPHRVVIDFKNTLAAKRVFKFTSTEGNAPIQGIRYSIGDDHSLRVVLDMHTTVGLLSRLKKSKKGTQVELILSHTSIGKKLKYAKKKTGKKVVKPNRAKSKSKPSNKKIFTVAIDPGHGGKDPGAIGLYGNNEKDVVLQIAKRLRDKINKHKGMRAIMTRSSDTFIPLQERVRIASRHRADLFISVHANANVRRSMSGSSVYVLSRRGASSQAARFIAARENAAQAKKLGDINFSGRNRMLKTVLLDLTRSSTLNRSLSLAKNVLKELSTINNLHRGRVESAAFVVLKSLEIPSMLVETAYISNPKEEMQLSQTAYQAKLASAIFKGVNSYYKRYIPKARYQVKSKSKTKPKSKVSPKSYQRYTVRKGDTLMSIVRKHKVTLSQLKNANDLQDTTIRSGQRLKIPNF